MSLVAIARCRCEGLSRLPIWQDLPEQPRRHLRDNRIGIVWRDFKDRENDGVGPGPNLF